MSDRHLVHLVEANRVFADQIKTADQKAAYIFTFVLALVVWAVMELFAPKGASPDVETVTEDAEQVAPAAD